MTKRIEEVLREIEEEENVHAAKYAVSNLKRVASADWGTHEFMEVHVASLRAIVDHIHRIEEELSKAKKQLNQKQSIKCSVEKFKAGDIVRLKNTSTKETFKVLKYSTGKYEQSCNGVSLQVHTAGKYWKTGDITWNPESGLELVSAPDRFQVGDRVRSREHKNLRYVITGPKTDNRYPVRPISKCATDNYRMEILTERTPLSEFTWEDLQVNDIVEYGGIRYTVIWKGDSSAKATSRGLSAVHFGGADLNKNVKVVDTPQ